MRKPTKYLLLFLFYWAEGIGSQELNKLLKAIHVMEPIGHIFSVAQDTVPSTVPQLLLGQERKHFLWVRMS